MTSPRLPLPCVALLLLALAGTATAGVTGLRGDNAPVRKCRALALQGGGDHGSYEAGVVTGFLNVMNATDLVYDVVTGISAGSLNTAGAGLYAVGDEANMAKFLVNTWLSMTKEDVYKGWFPGGDLQGLIFEQGIYDTSPLRKTLEKILTPGFKDRRLTIGSTSMTTGLLNHWNETSPDFVTGCMASTAIPGVFPMVHARGQGFNDGGVDYGVDVVSAVARCHEIVSDEADIIVDVILCDGDKVIPIDVVNDKTLTVFMRMMNIQGYHRSADNIAKAKAMFPKATFRMSVSPSVPLPSGSSLDFDKAKLQTMINLGIKDGETHAKNYLANRAASAFN